MAAQNAHNGRSMTEILQDIIADIQEIVRSEFRLAKAEVQEQAAKVARSGVPLIVGLLLGLYALGFLLLAMVHALSLVVDANIGRNRLKGVKVVPEKTIGTVKENVQWARNQIR